MTNHRPPPCRQRIDQRTGKCTGDPCLHVVEANNARIAAATARREAERIADAHGEVITADERNRVRRLALGPPVTDFQKAAVEARRRGMARRRK